MNFSPEKLAKLFISLGIIDERISLLKSNLLHSDNVPDDIEGEVGLIAEFFGGALEDLTKEDNDND